MVLPSVASNFGGQKTRICKERVHIEAIQHFSVYFKSTVRLGGEKIGRLRILEYANPNLLM